MKKITVDFRIQSTESKQQFTTEGTMDDNVITFDDPANETNIVEIQSDQVHYKKTGQSNLDFQFEQGQTKTGQYKVLHHVFEFDVVTTALDVQDNVLHVEYELHQNGERVNQTSLILQYALIKEES